MTMKAVLNLVGMPLPVKGRLKRMLDYRLINHFIGVGARLLKSGGLKMLFKRKSANVHSLEQQQLSSTVAAYMDVFRDRSVLELAENNRAVIARQLEATRDRFTLGELTKTDVSQAESRLASADAQIITAQGDLRSSEAVFEQVVGYRPEGLEYPYVEFAFPENLYDAIQVARRSNPEILSSIYTQRASEDDVDNIFGELLPEISFSGSFQKFYDPQPGSFDEQNSRTVGLTASIPLYKGGDVRSRVRQSKYTANQRMLQVREQERLVKSTVIQAWETLNTARAEIIARKAQVDAAKIAQEGVRAEADFGSRTVLDTLDADQELLDAEVAFVTAQRNKVVAEYALLETLGRLTPENLGFEEDTNHYHRDWEESKLDFFNMDVDRLGR